MSQKDPFGGYPLEYYISQAVNREKLRRLESPPKRDFNNDADGVIYTDSSPGVVLTRPNYTSSVVTMASVPTSPASPPILPTTSISPPVATTSSTPIFINADTIITSKPVPVVSSTSGPVVSTSGPVVSTSGPVVSTSGPVVSTSGPVVSTSGPVVSTSGPVVSSNADISALLSEDIVMQENDTNFGHNKIIWKGPVVFPRATDKKIVSIDNAGRYQYDDGTTSANELQFDKEKEVTDKYRSGSLTTGRDKDYFNLYKIGFKSIYDHTECEGPTLSLSLYMRTNVLYGNDYTSWTAKYFQQQLKMYLVFSHYFPNSVKRNYFDWYMLKKFRSMRGDDRSLIVTKHITNFDYDDFENTNNLQQIKQKLSDYYIYIRGFDNFPFANGLERILFYFDAACKFGGNLPGEFYVYKFSGPFIEDAGTDRENHITNGDLGVFFRYISLRQTDYEHYGKNFQHPKHLVWRDGHVCTPAFNDSLWIKALGKMDKETYLVCRTLGYGGVWDDQAPCYTMNGQAYAVKAFGGIAQIYDSSIHNNDELYLKTIGTMFLLDNNNSLPLLHHRPKAVWNKQTLDRYMYGIDEYVLGSFFKVEQIKRNTVYLNIKGFWEFWANWDIGAGILPTVFVKNNPTSYHLYNKAIVLLMSHLIKNNAFVLDTTLTRHSLIRYIENEREKKGVAKNKTVGFLLGLIPSKYFIQNCMFDKSAPDYANHMDNTTIGKVDDIFRTFSNGNDAMYNSLKIGIELKDNVLVDYGLFPKNTVVTSPTMEWCVYPYLQDGTPVVYNTGDYNSGYYEDLPTNNGSYFLRSPEDLFLVRKHREQNNLLIPLNISTYKLKAEKDAFRQVVVAGIDDGYSHIKPALQNIILYFGPPGSFIASIGLDDGKEGFELANKVSGLNPDGLFRTTDGPLRDPSKPENNDTTSPDFNPKLWSRGDPVTQSRMWCPLIWKALNYFGYDVPPEWFDRIELKSDEDYRAFNESVKKLAEMEEDGVKWADYAFYALKSGDNLDGINNDFEDANLKAKSADLLNRTKAEVVMPNVYKPYKMAVIGGGLKSHRERLMQIPIRRSKSTKYDGGSDPLLLVTGVAAGGLLLSAGMQYFMIAVAVCLFIVLLFIILSKSKKETTYYGEADFNASNSNYVECYY